MLKCFSMSVLQQVAWYSGGTVKNPLVFKGWLCYIYMYLCMYVYPKYASPQQSPLPASLHTVWLCLGTLPSSSTATPTPEIWLAKGLWWCCSTTGAMGLAASHAVSCLSASAVVGFESKDKQICANRDILLSQIILNCIRQDFCNPAADLWVMRFL